MFSGRLKTGKLHVRASRQRPDCACLHVGNHKNALRIRNPRRRPRRKARPGARPRDLESRRPIGFAGCSGLADSIYVYILDDNYQTRNLDANYQTRLAGQLARCIGSPGSRLQSQ